MADPFQNARAYYDVTFPSSGDSFMTVIANIKNAFQGLGFTDFIPLQPRAHNPPDTKIMVRGRDASNFYNPVYAGDANTRIFFASGDSPAFSAPASNPRLDIVYITASGDIRIQQGTEAANPELPSLAPSGDTRFPVCAVYNRPSQTKIVNFESKDASTGDGYIYQDLRPWLTQPRGAVFSTLTPTNPTGDAQAGPGTSTNAARADHVHGGVHGIRLVGSSLMQGDVEFTGGGLVQSGNRLTIRDGATFSANKNNVDQTINDNSSTKVTWPVIEYDTNASFDTANSRFLPNVAGYYFLTVAIEFTTMVDNSPITLAIFKNGGLYKQTSMRSTGTSAQGIAFSCIASANGSTDYFEVFTTQVTAGSKDIDGTIAKSLFQGSYVRHL